MIVFGLCAVLGPFGVGAVARVEGMTSLGLRVDESFFSISMTQSFVFAYPSSPSSSELIQDLHPPPSPLSTFSTNHLHVFSSQRLLLRGKYPLLGRV